MKYCQVILLMGLFFLSAALKAQETTGIHFENDLSWSAVKAKAKSENKYIFMDCYATWCGPCKKMDKEVYTVDSIGKFFSANFISVKVQLDSSSKDDASVRAWYADAHSILNQYKIAAFPTFLFFTPDGKIAHKGIGYNPPIFFNQIARNALIPAKQFYTKLDNFQQGRMAYTDMPDLAIAARALQENATARLIANTYFNDYLRKLDEKELYTDRNIKVIAALLTSSDDKEFKILYDHPALVDSALQIEGFARNTIEFIVEKEEINNTIYKNGEPFELLGAVPDWNKLTQTITKKYNEDYAGRVVLWAKIRWLEHNMKWPEYAKSVLLKIEKYGPYDKYRPRFNLPDHVRLNASAWELFMYSGITKDLKKALAMSDKTIKSISYEDPEYFDTYANLLYKLGRTKEAIEYEEKALSLSPGKFDFKDNLEKMHRGEPTWIAPAKSKK